VTATPGPWRVADSGGKYRVVGHGEQANGLYGLQEEACVCYGGASGEERAEANARLIAAAPDLLAACRDMLEKIHRLYPLDWQGTKGMARAAIAKAEGSSL
jgi:hypothetical protein